MKVGDKVRFLNEVGGGIVKRLIGKDQVSIEDADGFEIPMLMRECVVVDTDDYNIARQPTSVAKDVPGTANRTSTSKARKPEMAPERGYESVAAAFGMAAKSTDADKVNVMIAFVPTDILALSSSSYDMYLINDCNYKLFYVIHSAEGSKWRVRSSGVAEPDTKVYIEEIEKINLDELDPLIVQVIPFKEGVSYPYKPSVTVQLKIDLVRFYKLNAFQRTDFFEDPALLQKVIDNDHVVKQLSINPAVLEKEMMSKKQMEESNIANNHQPKKQETNTLIEIDLHIDNLLDTTSGMSHKEMLDYQIKKFVEVMEENKSRKNAKIVFIHGKGNGVLRQKLLEELKRRYRSCAWQDASFQQYGFGATQITIH